MMQLCNMIMMPYNSIYDIKQRSLNKTFNPTTHDINGFSRILDKNQDGIVTYPDIEKLVFNFLEGAE